MEQLKNTYKVIAFAIPISTSILVSMLSSFFALLMVAQLGKLELAAAALAVPTFMTIMTTFSMIFYSVGILICHTNGQHSSPKMIGQIVKNGFWLAVILLIPSSIILWNIQKILIFCKQDPDIVARTSLYFHFSVFSMISTLICAIIAQFFVGIGKSKFTLISSAVNLPMILFLSNGFILGNFGFPKLGLAGASFAVFLSQILSSIPIIIYMMTNKNLKKYCIFSGSFWPNGTLIRKIFTLGLPIGLQFGGELAAMTVATYFMGFFGVTALAASQIVSQYSILFIMIVLGLSQGMSLLMSEAYAKQDIALIRLYVNSSLNIVLMLFILIFPLFFFFPEILTKMYISAGNINNSNFMVLTNHLFAIASILILMDGLRNILSGALRGLQDSKTPMKIGVSCLWLVSLPISYLVAFVFNGGPVGLRAAFISGYAVAAMLLWIRVQKKIANLTDKESSILKGSLLEA
ncbi:MAG: MATE family efflux transporter [Legionella sp.]|nr:MATE family efflux transporter [Legionella sp.]